MVKVSNVTRYDVLDGGNQLGSISIRKCPITNANYLDAEYFGKRWKEAWQDDHIANVPFVDFLVNISKHDLAKAFGCNTKVDRVATVVNMESDINSAFKLKSISDGEYSRLMEDVLAIRFSYVIDINVATDLIRPMKHLMKFYNGSVEIIMTSNDEFDEFWDDVWTRFTEFLLNNK